MRSRWRGYRHSVARGRDDEFASVARERLATEGTTRQVPRRTTVFHEHDEPHAVFVVEQGLLRVDRTLFSGRSVLVTLAVPGDLVGELSVIDAAKRSATASAVVDSRLFVVPAPAFRRLLREDEEMTRAMLTSVTRRLRSLTDQFVESSAHGATSRVAARLVELLRVTARDAAGPIELQLPITQAELAQWAGLSREGAVKGIAELRRSGVIATGRKRMTVLDTEELRRIAAQTDR